MGNIKLALLATVVNYLTYSLWTMANKWQFNSTEKGGFGVKTPFLATSFQMLLAGAIAFFSVQVLGYQKPSGSLLTADVLKKKILPLGCARSIDIGCGNFALSLVTVAVQQVIKSTLPVFVSVLSMLLLNKYISFEAWLTLLPVVIGTVLATYGDLDFSGLGITLALISCFGRAFKAVLNAKLLHAAQDSMQPLQILLLEAPTTGVLILIPSALVETHLIGETWHLLTGAAWLNICCGFLMFFNQLTYITIIEHTSAVSCQVLMNVKMLLLILVSIHVFHTHLSMINYVGLVVATAGCFIYSKVLASQSAKPKQAEHVV